MARGVKQGAAQSTQSKGRAKRTASETLPSEEAADADAELPDDGVEDELDDEVLDDDQPAKGKSASGRRAAVEDDDFVSDGDDDEAVDLDALTDKEINAKALAIRREIERRLEQKRLARELDDLDLDLDD